MKIREVPEDPTNPDSDWIIEFDFDDSVEDTMLLNLFRAAAKAADMSIEEYLIKVILEQANKTIEQDKPKKKTKVKKKKKLSADLAPPPPPPPPPRMVREGVEIIDTEKPKRKKSKKKKK